MKIAFDARFASNHISNGQSAYLHNLLQQLAKLDHRNDYILLTNKLCEGSVEGLGAKFKFLAIPNLPHRIRKMLPWQNTWWRGLIGLTLALRVRPDLTVSAINVGPSGNRTGNYIAIAHDLDYIQFPELYTKANGEKNRINTELSLRSADHIIAISHATKKQILDLYDYDADKITVIHHGYDKNLFHANYPDGLTGKIRRKYRLPESFIFSIGSLSPKKNISLIFKAISLLKFERKHSIYCVLAGSFAPDTRAKLENELEGLGIRENVKFIGFVLNEDLPLIYRASTLFAFPSFAEGFGLPIVEAMSCGCPVLTSNTSCLPEIAGEAAITCDPTDVSAFAEAILTVFGSTNMQIKLREQGLQRAQLFSWEKTAQATLDVFNSINRK